MVAPPDPRYRDHWRVGAARFRSPVDHVGRSTVSTTTTSGHAVHGDGSMTSSPVTSVSDGQAGDAWRDSPLRRETRDEMSPMSDNSAALPNNLRSKEINKADKPKSVEIKVQRTERVERREKFDSKDWLNNNDTYAMPRMQPSFGSRSSLATSQARGESSDIDFSWIREEENKLRSERENLKRLPECYFGMDPPKIEDACDVREREEKENLRRGNVRTTTAAFEQELAKEKREQAFKSRSSAHLEDRRQEHSPRREMGPMARRLQRMQREAEVANRDYGDRDECRQRWRSSMAF